KLQGTYRKDRRPANELQPGVRLPEPPAWLGREGRKVYRKLGKALVQMGVMSELDRTALGLLAHEWVRYLEASRLVNTEGAVLVGGKRGYYQHPCVGIANRCLK